MATTHSNHTVESDCCHNSMTSSRARDVISRATSRAAHLWHQTDGRRSPEYAKFRIFQIGPLLREIRPFSWNQDKNRQGCNIFFFNACIILLLMRDFFVTVLWISSTFSKVILCACPELHRGGDHITIRQQWDLRTRVRLGTPLARR